MVTAIDENNGEALQSAINALKPKDVNFVVVTMTPLAHAAGYPDRTEAIQILLKAGANPNFQNRQGDGPLSMAVRWGGPQIVELLLKAGAEVNIRNASGITPLNELAQLTGYYNKSDRNRIAELLLQNGADPSIADNQGNTALSLASKRHLGGMLHLFRQYGKCSDEYVMDYWIESE
jgi:ankyrin repeat protein